MVFFNGLHKYGFKISKSHHNDAFVIAGGTIQERTKVQYYGFKKKNNRSLGKRQKGRKPSNRKQRYPIQSKDIIEFEGKRYISKGNSSKGASIRINHLNIKTVSSKKVKLIFHIKGIYKLAN